MTDLQSLIERSVISAVTRVFGEGYADVDPMVRPAANRQFGDYQADLAMGLSKRVGLAPREAAQRLAKALEGEPWPEQVSVAGPGFINFVLKQSVLEERAAALLRDPRLGIAAAVPPELVVVDYSSPNVAKEMHVGHLRSTIIGDSIVRVLEFLGHQVVRQNHVGDWGTQFGMLIEHLLDREPVIQSHDVVELNGLYQEAKRRFDDDAQFAERTRQRVVRLQGGDPKTFAIWRQLVAISEQHFGEVYRRLGVKLTVEDNRGESFYNDRLESVVTDLNRLSALRESQGAQVVYPGGFKDRDGNPLPMIVRKGDGGYLYATTDLAAARYRIDELKAQRVIYVTDARQRDHFGMVFAILRQTGWAHGGVRLEHVPFGSVLGKDRKPFKTRAGGTVRLVELIDEAERRAVEIIKTKNPEMPAAQQREVASVVGLGALKYADLSNDRIKNYIFDWDKMLAFDGNTAPYLQNAYVRIQAIFRRGQIDTADLADQRLTITESQERELVLQILRFPHSVRLVAETLEPHHLCAYLYELAVLFHHFYEHCPVLNADDPRIRSTRLALCELVGHGLQTGLGLLGIGLVDQM